jgi:hypothetical protein
MNTKNAASKNTTQKEASRLRDHAEKGSLAGAEEYQKPDYNEMLKVCWDLIR